MNETGRPKVLGLEEMIRLLPTENRLAMWRAVERLKAPSGFNHNQPFLKLTTLNPAGDEFIVDYMRVTKFHMV